MYWRRFCLRIFTPGKFTATKGLVLALTLTVASLLCLSYYVLDFSVDKSGDFGPTEQGVQGVVPQELRQASSSSGLNVQTLKHPPNLLPQFNVTQNMKFDQRALVLVETHFTRQGQDILVFLDYNRFRYKVELASKNLPNLTHKDKGKYSLVVFERFESYLNMDRWNRDLLDSYCRAYSAGIMAFTYPEQILYNAQARGFPLSVHTQLSLRNFEINPYSPILRVTRPGNIYGTNLPGSDWTVFQPNHTTYSPIAWAQLDIQAAANMTRKQLMLKQDYKHITAVLDKGFYDGVQKIIFGNHLRFWLHKVLLLDAISYLTHGHMSTSLERYILIDIDDIFVGRTGIRMKPSDVEALIESQSRLAQKVPGFHFNLGFSGKLFHSGSEDENAGDDALLAHRQAFWWFGHIWSHAQAHKLNYTEIKQEMSLNKQFARDHDIPVNQSYAVAPHHSGVFPVHEELYEAWRRVWGVKVTSTEEYPHLKPAQQRRGFIHRGIKVIPRQLWGLFTHTLFLREYPEGPEHLLSSKEGGHLFLPILIMPVLPRQTCGLFTKNLLFADYPGGPAKLDQSIHGGELFQTFLLTPVMVFMTHLSNYGNDRLALYTFEKAVDFVQKWTTLKLQTRPPQQLADIYFNMFPLEKNPLWKNPCDDKRHLEIWASHKSCHRLPELIIIGPQKSGTTALYSFLNMHPAIVSSYSSPITFEEVQFFNGKNYFKGLDWYLEFFPEPPPNRSRPLLFEKSANYFDSELTPLRIQALLPQAKLISILIDPADRAYSWYQHQRAHEDPTALQYSFYQVVTARDQAPARLRDLRKRCLGPGLYAQHLENWISYFPQKQLLILDGDQLKSDPISVMDRVQQFLGVSPYMDYSLKLRYSSSKGFYCERIDQDETKCLGKGKGRHYETMEMRAGAYLQNYFRKPNIALSKLLTKLGQTLPEWLKTDLANVR